MNEIFNIKQEFPELRDINIINGKEKSLQKQKDFTFGQGRRTIKYFDLSFSYFHQSQCIFTDDLLMN